MCAVQKGQTTRQQRDMLTSRRFVFHVPEGMCSAEAGLPVVGHAQDGVVVGLDGSLAFSRPDVPVPQEEASARGHDLRPVRVQREGHLKAKKQESSERGKCTERATE